MVAPRFSPLGTFSVDRPGSMRDVTMIILCVIDYIMSHSREILQM